MESIYVAYMLRLWMTEEAGKEVWRASLECPKNGDMLYFASLTRLFQFLESSGKLQKTGGSESPEDGAPSANGPPRDAVDREECPIKEP